jgi:ketopantoate reductase
MFEVKRGRIYLSALGHDLGHSQMSQMRCHPPVERWARPGHMLSILTATPELQAAGFNLEQFLDFKLPLMVFKCVVDPLTVTLDSTYERLLNNNYAQQMMDQLLGEIINVISRLPELRGSTKYNKLRGGGGLREAVHRQLDLKKNAESRMRALTRRGWETDIDFLNGYFVKRARDVGVRCPANESIMWMVKARHEAQLAQRREEIEWDYDY